MNPNLAQLPTWMFRLVQRPGDARQSSLMGERIGGHTRSRIEVCPPEVWPSSVGWRGSLKRWFNQQVKRLPEPAQPINRLALVKDEFLALLSDVDHSHACLLAERLARARSLRELWHLRSSLYNLVSVAMSQGEAERRLTRLNRHFPTRANRGPSQALDA